MKILQWAQERISNSGFIRLGLNEVGEINGPRALRVSALLPSSTLYLCLPFTDGSSIAKHGGAPLPAQEAMVWYGRNRHPNRSDANWRVCEHRLRTVGQLARAQGPSSIDDPIRHFFNLCRNQKITVSPTFIELFGAARSFGLHRDEFQTLK